jgi:hypothetical protein
MVAKSRKYGSYPMGDNADAIGGEIHRVLAREVAIAIAEGSLVEPKLVPSSGELGNKAAEVNEIYR